MDFTGGYVPRRLLLGLVLAAGAGIGATVAGTGSADPFVTPAALEGHVGFWRNVFGVWSMGQVAIHDMEHPSLVYEVFDLPGPKDGAYTDAQREIVQARREGWESRLLNVERKILAGEILGDDDKELALRVSTTAGTAGVYGAAARVRSQRGIRERFRRGLEISHRYEGMFREIFREARLPEDLSYLPHVESSFQLSAYSSAGAVGVWQFTRSTGRTFLRIDQVTDERLDPIAAARGAARYFRKAYDTLGSWPLAVTSYNHGIAGMARARAAFGTQFERIVREYDAPSFGFASRNFYCEFLAAREIARNPAVYFPEGIVPEAPFPGERLVLPRKTTVHDVATNYGLDLAELRRLNPALTARAASGRVPLPAGLALWVPAGARAGGRSAGGEWVADDRTPESAATDRGTPAGAGADSEVEYRYHRVRRGDTLWSVSKRYGIGIADLRRLNGLPTRAKTIRSGQTLKVGRAKAAGRSVADAVSHVVQPGETVFRIAMSYGVQVADVMVANALDEATVIRPGQRLRIPSSR